MLSGRVTVVKACLAITIEEEETGADKVSEAEWKVWVERSPVGLHPRFCFHFATCLFQFFCFPDKLQHNVSSAAIFIFLSRIPTLLRELQI